MHYSGDFRLLFLTDAMLVKSSEEQNLPTETRYRVRANGQAIEMDADSPDTT